MTRRLLLKILERVVWTFIEGACATLLLGQAFNLSALEAAALGGVAAVISLVKNVAGTRLGDKNSPAWLPAEVTTAATVTGQVVATTGEVVGEVVGEVTDILGDK